MGKTYVQGHMRRQLESHALSQLKTEGPVQMFYLHEKTAKVGAGEQLIGRMMSTLFVFTPEGIVITGDLCPRACKRGCISDLGYSLGWFAGDLGEDYLCEKFLERGFHGENIEEWLADVRDHDEDQNKQRVAAELVECVPTESDEAASFLFGALEKLGEDYDGQAWGYDPSDAGWLCALQQRFAVLYRSGQVRATT